MSPTVFIFGASTIH